MCVCECAYHNTCSKYLRGILIIFLTRSLLSAQLNLMNMSIMKEMSIWDKLISIDTTEEQHEKRKEAEYYDVFIAHSFGDKKKATVEWELFYLIPHI